MSNYESKSKYVIRGTSTPWNSAADARESDVGVHLARGLRAPRTAVERHVLEAPSHAQLQREARQVTQHRAGDAPRAGEEGELQQSLEQDLRAQRAGVVALLDP